MDYTQLEKIGAYDHAGRTLNLQPGHTVVDVGCGAGGFLRWMTGRGITTIGVECGDIMLAEAQRLNSGDVREGVGQNLPVPDETADAVTFMASLHHIPANDMVASLQEAARVLRPGGKIYVAEPIADGPSYAVGRLVDDEAEVRAVAQAVLADCSRAGLKIVNEGRYVDEYVYRDVNAFGKIMVGIDPERAAVYEQVKDAVAQAFQANGRKVDHGVAFDQPKQYHLLAAL